MPASPTPSAAPPSADSDRTRSLLAAVATLAALACASLVPLEPLTKNLAGERVAYRHETYELDPRFVADAGPRSRHASNAQGLRGDVIVGRDLELLTLGGSTVECSLLDEPDALTARIAQAAAPQVQHPLRAAALAQAGLPLSELLTELEQFTADRRRPDLIVGMFGANEAQAFFNHAPWVSQAKGAAWDVWLDPASPFGTQGRSQTYRGWYQPGNHGGFLSAPRAAYADPRGWVDELHPGHVPLLRAALADYVTSLAALERLTHDRGAKLVLVTQPIAPWSAPADGRGWAPFVYAEQGQGFLPSPDLTGKLVEAFNAQTRGFAAERGLVLVDLAVELQGCAACFYDQWHFSDTGAARAGAAIAAVAAAELPNKP
ncbi:hypothetical protein DB30_04312 [Enhygromyxa salina]|uniref:SGNH hydrolase-type esterase domain-containing protein n=1 Tax=Enhygromyxa salina TaxID=215803 RepID=A0A0C2CZY3_9BACT|nr:hypothetical protein [Enhygromyxa salina]KIG16541.1 hypothetical protein DB30_04312 [Enhygromyxa salina]